MQGSDAEAKTHQDLHALTLQVYRTTVPAHMTAQRLLGFAAVAMNLGATKSARHMLGAGAIVAILAPQGGPTRYRLYACNALLPNPLPRGIILEGRVRSSRSRYSQ